MPQCSPGWALPAAIPTTTSAAMTTEVYLRTCQLCHWSCNECHRPGDPDQCVSCSESRYLTQIGADSTVSVGRCVLSPRCSIQQPLTVNLTERIAQAIRLVNGSTFREGRLEVFVAGRWGSVCSNGFTQREGDVACRHLGLTGALEVVGTTVFGESRGPIALNSVSCAGDEEVLLACVYQLYHGDCSHNQDVGLRCSGPASELFCTASCPDGTYLQSAMDTICSTCTSECKTCSDVTYACTSCYRNAFLHQSRCLRVCPVGFHGDTRVGRCVPCGGNCSTCSGPAANDCTSCADGDLLLNGQCLRDLSCSSCAQCVSLCSSSSQVCVENHLHLVAANEQVSSSSTDAAEGGFDLSGRLEVTQSMPSSTQLVRLPICSDVFTLQDASVACRQLGLGSPEDVVHALNGKSYYVLLFTMSFFYYFPCNTKQSYILNFTGTVQRAFFVRPWI